MKKCPFCAEEIQDEAIKCRFCNSFLNAAPAGAAPEAAAAAPFAAAAAPAAAAPVAAVAPLAPAVPTVDHKIIYEGSPSWRAFIGYYLLSSLAAAVAIVITRAVTEVEAPWTTKTLDVVIPVAAVAVFWTAVWLYRRSVKFRITATAIETERGVLSKRIDVLQLWRVRDVRYRQNVADRILGIAHIEVLAQDTANPQLEITGMPASRRLFEQLRDSVEIQRQAKNVYGVIS